MLGLWKSKQGSKAFFFEKKKQKTFVCLQLKQSVLQCEFGADLSGNGAELPDAGRIRLGPEIISDFARARRAEGRVWADGYTQSEIDTAQEKFGLVFPPDLASLFLERRPVMGWDYRSDDVHIRTMLERPLQGLLFDLEHNGLWWPE